LKALCVRSRFNGCRMIIPVNEQRRGKRTEAHQDQGMFEYERGLCHLSLVKGNPLLYQIRTISSLGLNVYRPGHLFPLLKRIFNGCKHPVSRSSGILP